MMNSSFVNKVNSVLNDFDDNNMQAILLCVEEHIDDKTQETLKKQEVVSIVQDNFLEECELFLKQNERLYNYSKKICKRAEEIANQIEKVQKYLQIKTSTELEISVRRLLDKSKLTEQRQATLTKLCEYILIPNELLNKITDANNNKIDKKFFEAVRLVEKQKMLIFTLQSFGQSNLSQSVKKNYLALYNLAITKAIKSIRSIHEIQDISLIKEFKDLLKDTEQNKSKFKQAIINSRIQINRNHFLPLLNKMNYSLKMQLEEYYKQILPEILIKFQKEKSFIKEIFNEEQERTEILEKLLNSFLPEIYSKLERSFYKTTDFMTFVKIKNIYHEHELQFKKMMGYDFKMSQIVASMAKLTVCIQASLAAEAEKLIKYKYNIYSISSYMILSEHLKSVYQSYKLNSIYNNSGNEIWLMAFCKFSNSRVYNQSNKSLVIFNLNMWQIYKNIWFEQKITYEKQDLNKKCQKILTECSKIFINMNLSLMSKLLPKFESKNKKQILSLLLDLFSQDYKKIIFSELNLIVHENIRNGIKKQLISDFLENYEEYIKVIPAQNNQTLKTLCTTESVNIKKLGKAADSVRILAIEEIKVFLQN